MRVKENPQRKPGEHGMYALDKFTYDAETNSLTCPQGKRLPYVSTNFKERKHVYASTLKRCRDCPVKSECTTGRFRTVAISMYEAARQRADEVAKTPAFAKSQCDRRKVEALWAELKNRLGLRRLRLRRMKFVREQFYLGATVQNMKRLVRFLSMKPNNPVAAAV
jgi:hypothetical protein